MASAGRVLLDATVTDVGLGPFVYPACGQCYSKLEFVKLRDCQLHQCQNCGRSYSSGQEQFRYRLCLTVTDGSTLANLTIFGGVLNSFFGFSATEFHNRVMSSAEHKYGPSYGNIIQVAVEEAFVGQRLLFGLKTSSSNATQKHSNHVNKHGAISLRDICQSSNTSSQKTTGRHFPDLIAVQIMPLTDSSFSATVVECLNNLEVIIEECNLTPDTYSNRTSLLQMLHFCPSSKEDKHFSLSNSFMRHVRQSPAVIPSCDNTAGSSLDQTSLAFSCDDSLDTIFVPPMSSLDTIFVPPKSSLDTIFVPPMSSLDTIFVPKGPGLTVCTSCEPESAVCLPDLHVSTVDQEGEFRSFCENGKSVKCCSFCHKYEIGQSQIRNHLTIQQAGDLEGILKKTYCECVGLHKHETRSSDSVTNRKLCGECKHSQKVVCDQNDINKSEMKIVGEKNRHRMKTVCDHSNINRSEVKTVDEKNRQKMKTVCDQSDMTKCDFKAACDNSGVEKHTIKTVCNQSYVDRHNVKTVCDQSDVDRRDVKTVCDQSDVDRHNFKTVCDQSDVDRHNLKTVCGRSDINRHDVKTACGKNYVDRCNAKTICGRIDLNRCNEKTICGHCSLDSQKVKTVCSQNDVNRLPCVYTSVNEEHKHGIVLEYYTNQDIVNLENKENFHTTTTSCQMKHHLQKPAAQNCQLSLQYSPVSVNKGSFCRRRMLKKQFIEAQEFCQGDSLSTDSKELASTSCPANAKNHVVEMFGLSDSHTETELTGDLSQQPRKKAHSRQVPLRLFHSGQITTDATSDKERSHNVISGANKKSLSNRYNKEMCAKVMSQVTEFAEDISKGLMEEYASKAMEDCLFKKREHTSSKLIEDYPESEGLEIFLSKIREDNPSKLMEDFSSELVDDYLESEGLGVLLSKIREDNPSKLMEDFSSELVDDYLESEGLGVLLSKIREYNSSKIMEDTALKIMEDTASKIMVDTPLKIMEDYPESEGLDVLLSKIREDNLSKLFDSAASKLREDYPKCDKHFKQNVFLPALMEDYPSELMIDYPESENLDVFLPPKRGDNLRMSRESFSSTLIEVYPESESFNVFLSKVKEDSPSKLIKDYPSKLVKDCSESEDHSSSLREDNPSQLRLKDGYQSNLRGYYPPQLVENYPESEEFDAFLTKLNSSTTDHSNLQSQSITTENSTDDVHMKKLNDIAVGSTNDQKMMNTTQHSCVMECETLGRDRAEDGPSAARLPSVVPVDSGHFDVPVDSGHFDKAKKQTASRFFKNSQQQSICQTDKICHAFRNIKTLQKPDLSHNNNSSLKQSTSQHIHYFRETGACKNVKKRDMSRNSKTLMKQDVPKNVKSVKKHSVSWNIKTAKKQGVPQTDTNPEKPALCEAVQAHQKSAEHVKDVKKDQLSPNTSDPQKQILSPLFENHEQTCKTAAISNSFKLGGSDIDNNSRHLTSSKTFGNKEILLQMEVVTNAEEGQSVQNVRLSAMQTLSLHNSVKASEKCKIQKKHFVGHSEKQILAGKATGEKKHVLLKSSQSQEKNTFPHRSKNEKKLTFLQGVANLRKQPATSNVTTQKEWPSQHIVQMSQKHTLPLNCTTPKQVLPNVKSSLMGDFFSQDTTPMKISQQSMKISERIVFSANSTNLKKQTTQKVKSSVRNAHSFKYATPHLLTLQQHCKDNSTKVFLNYTTSKKTLQRNMKNPEKTLPSKYSVRRQQVCPKIPTFSEKLSSPRDTTPKSQISDRNVKNLENPTLARSSENTVKRVLKLAGNTPTTEVNTQSFDLNSLSVNVTLRRPKRKYHASQLDDTNNKTSTNLFVCESTHSKTCSGQVNSDICALAKSPTGKISRLSCLDSWRESGDLVQTMDSLFLVNSCLYEGNSHRIVQKDSSNMSEKNSQKDSRSRSHRNGEKNNNMSHQHFQKVTTSMSDRNIEEDSTSIADKSGQKDSTSLSHRNIQKDSTDLSHRNIHKDNTDLSHRSVQKDNPDLSHRNIQNDCTSLSHRNIQKDSTDLSHRNIQKDSPDLSHRNTQKDSTDLSHRSIQKDSTGLSHRNIQKDSTGLSHRNIQKDSTDLSHRNIQKDSPDVSHRNIQKDSTDLSHRNTQKDSTDLSHRSIQKDSTGLSHRNIQKDSTGLSHRNIQKDSTGLSHRNIQKDSTNIADKSVQKDCTSLSHRNIQKDRTSLSRRNIQKDRTNLSRRNIQKDSTDLSHRNIQKDSTDLSHRSVQKDSPDLSHRNIQNDCTSLSHRNIQKDSTSIADKSVQKDCTNLSHRNIQKDSSSIADKSVQKDCTSVSHKNIQKDSNSIPDRNMPNDSTDRPLQVSISNRKSSTPGVCTYDVGTAHLETPLPIWPHGCKQNSGWTDLPVSFMEKTNSVFVTSEVLSQERVFGNLSGQGDSDYRLGESFGDSDNLGHRKDIPASQLVVCSESNGCNKEIIDANNHVTNINDLNDYATETMETNYVEEIRDMKEQVTEITNMKGRVAKIHNAKNSIAEVTDIRDCFTEILDINNADTEMNNRVTKITYWNNHVNKTTDVNNYITEMAVNKAVAEINDKNETTSGMSLLEDISASSGVLWESTHHDISDDSSVRELDDRLQREQDVRSQTTGRIQQFVVETTQLHCQSLEHHNNEHLSSISGETLYPDREGDKLLICDRCPKSENSKFLMCAACQKIENDKPLICDLGTVKALTNSGMCQKRLQVSDAAVDTFSSQGSTHLAEDVDKVLSDSINDLFSSEDEDSVFVSHASLTSEFGRGKCDVAQKTLLLPKPCVASVGLDRSYSESTDNTFVNIQRQRVISGNVVPDALLLHKTNSTSEEHTKYYSKNQLGNISGRIQATKQVRFSEKNQEHNYFTYEVISHQPVVNLKMYQLKSSLKKGDTEWELSGSQDLFSEPSEASTPTRAESGSHFPHDDWNSSSDLFLQTPEQPNKKCVLLPRNTTREQASNKINTSSMSRIGGIIVCAQPETLLTDHSFDLFTPSPSTRNNLNSDSLFSSEVCGCPVQVCITPDLFS